ncbi:MAG: hypothetical protein HY961_10740 [Ignavibacteriae bacterium]|nr:hypothetical protein [Ignavibacteriota bacterium]
MIKNLSFDELMRLFHSVFALRADEDELTFMLDLPDEKVPDNDAWHDRRRIVGEWYGWLNANSTQTPFSEINLCTYQNVGANNGDLPPFIKKINEYIGDASLGSGMLVSLDEVLAASSVVVSVPELSATAPLKMFAKKFRFRGASMPGFLRSMIPSLSLDYEKVHARVVQFQERMELADGVRIRLRANGTTYESLYDLRYRPAHASGGLMREPGVVANLPSGEAYITPYEGERTNEPSRTAGLLPVQFEDEIVVYRIENNRAVEVVSQGVCSKSERDKLGEEPAYGNIAEVGIGVLGEWGVKAVGSTLLDEKLGLHIAFGRSEHFGGVTSPRSFNNPKNVIHIDRVYVPSVQPRISVEEVTFLFGGREELIMREGSFLV